ncbi:putative amine oxidase [Brazilian marseillevirus]|uniref:putative amine oxidase n=1 Tax=Brazilian marseillevirus TaxID=1813599 RepID=UPI000781E161|nr:putative amine oxidase [Brazilian marseillevirus]AMQ10609.1 putative amine oxidase [Brazilian marseillevirus]
MEEFDTLVVGAGIGGSFFTWRLNSERSEEKILLIEKEQEVGGRLWSVPLGNGDFLELGVINISRNIYAFYETILQRFFVSPVSNALCAFSDGVTHSRLEKWLLLLFPSTWSIHFFSSVIPPQKAIATRRCTRHVFFEIFTYRYPFCFGKPNVFLFPSAQILPWEETCKFLPEKSNSFQNSPSRFSSSYLQTNPA